MKIPIYYIKELNYRIIYTIFGSVLFFFTTYQYKQGIIYVILPGGLSYFITTDLTEIFFTYLQLCTFFTFGITLFLLPIQIYWFLRPGLYNYESKRIILILALTTSLYLWLYTFMAPTAIKFFWNLFTVYAEDFSPVNLTFEPRLNDYLKHLIQVYTFFFLAVPFLIALNVLQRNTSQNFWAKYRSLNYLLMFSIAALITPPDIISQMIVGIPFVIIYETHVFTWSLVKEYKKQLIRKPIKT